MTKTLLACGALAGPLFVSAIVVEGATRPGYDPIRHPVSSLAIGERGWTQRANFLATGLSTLAAAAGLRGALRPSGGPAWGPHLVGAYGTGLLGAGTFNADPMNGYPPGTPDRRSRFTTHGVLHDLFSSLVFFGLPAACWAFSRRFASRGERGWAAYSAATGAVFATAFVLSNAGFAQAKGLAGLAGLFQRVALVSGSGWLSLLTLRHRRVLREG